MNPLTAALAASALAVVAGLGYVARQVRLRQLDRWIVSYLAQAWARRGDPGDGPIHLILCIADHYEPKWGDAPPEVARERVETWVREYPRLFAGFRDSDGRPPRHSFFYPAEEYEPEHLDALAGLCRQGFGEVEVHLHHDDDTAENLRKTLIDFKTTLAERHGLLARDPATGEPVYAFIHGNWALDNSRPDAGRLVRRRKTTSFSTSCARDRLLRRLHDAVGPRARPRPARSTASITRSTTPSVRSRTTAASRSARLPSPANSLLLIQGPLVLDLKNRRVENGCLQGNQPAHMSRVDAWLRARVQVPSRPDWFFVKLYTHGATEENQEVVLGPPMVDFHEALARRAADDPAFRYHYVTAREMYNLAKAAEAGWRGTVDEARDFVLRWDGASPGGGATPMTRRHAIETAPRRFWNGRAFLRGGRRAWPLPRRRGAPGGPTRRTRAWEGRRASLPRRLPLESGRLAAPPVDPGLRDPRSGRIGLLDKPLHPDFGTVYQGHPSGIPFVVVPGDQPKVPVRFEYAGESDPGPYPIPDDAPIEGGPDGKGDRHVLVVDRDRWVAYELFDAHKDGRGWRAGSGAIFDLASNTTRRAGWTSADAAGLPILPGLVRYDEVVEKKAIRHALRFTCRLTRHAYVAPARHFASRSDDPKLPPMGMRVRLKASVPIDRFPPEARVILAALKAYGMLLADNGSDWFVSGAPDPRWDDEAIGTLKRITGRDFEVVKMGRPVTR